MTRSRSWRRSCGVIWAQVRSQPARSLASLENNLNVVKILDAARGISPIGTDGEIGDMTDHCGTAQPAFTNETFALLAGIAATPTAGFYLDHKLDLKVHVEQPLRRLMLGAAARLPAVFRERMETERGLFSRFLKNDFGRGGAWSHYTGRILPKRQHRRLADVQLAVGIHADLLQVSFYIGDYAPQQRVRFLRNLNRHRRLLPDLLHELITDPRVLFARGGTRFDENGQAVGLEPSANLAGVAV